MDNKKTRKTVDSRGSSARGKTTEEGAPEKVNHSAAKRQGKLSEYGKQLQEKQKVKEMYGLLEKQFKKFFAKAMRQEGAPGENLLSLLERRIDNVLYRLKMSVTRVQARQVVVHGHVRVNGKKVYSPSYLVAVGDIVTLANGIEKKEKFLESVVDKRLNIGIKVPEWLELNKQDRKGAVLRFPVRSDIQVQVEEHLIVELYSK